MEFKDGKVVPTSDDEAEVFSKYLREQALVSAKDPSTATKAIQGEELDELDSYRLFCGMERAVKDPEHRLGDRHREIVVSAIGQLAQHRIDELQSAVDGLDGGLSDADVVNAACQLAGGAVRSSG